MNYICCDLDGTIANHDHRKHFLAQKPKDWKSFFGAMSDDIPIDATVNLLHMCWTSDLAPTIIILSARPGEYRKTTLHWLDLHSVPFHELRQRAQGDYRDDTIVKKEMLTRLRYEFKTDPLFVIDDRQKVVDMWREEGLICFQARPSEEF